MSYPYYGSVQSKKSVEIDQMRNKPTRFFSPTVIGLVCVSVVAGGIWVNRSFHSAVETAVSTKAATNRATLSKLDFTLVRSMYDPLPYFQDTYTSYLNYAILKDFDAVVEPYQTMDLHFYDSTDTTKSNYIFKVCPQGSTENCQEGYSYTSTNGKGTTKKGVKFECSAYTKYDMTLYTVDNDGNVLASQAGSALCLYVRREIRSLTPSDLSAYMDANYVVYSTKDEDGQKKYGPAFVNSTMMMRYHHFNSAQQDSDHIHEGNGFLIQHLKLTNIFDASVMLVDPSQSIPYWDFTIDSVNGKHAWESFVLTPETYGSMKIPNNISLGFRYEADKVVDGRIVDGRWKDLKVDENWYYPDLKYGYGYLRGPWNMNPSPYISRFAFDFPQNIDLPDCSSHYSAFAFDDLMDFFYWNSFSPHSLTHTTIGGFFGCDLFDDLVEKGVFYDKADALKVCSSWPFQIKEFWRANYITARKDCTVTGAAEDSTCGFDCNPETLENLWEFFYPLFQSVINSDNLDVAKKEMMEFICNGKTGKFFTGDHLESASPGDPSFWVIHPTLERLLHAKLLAGGFASEAWTSDVVNDFVCIKSTCYNSTTGTSDYYEDCCYGHFENDRLLDPISGDRNIRVGPTNAEVYAKTDPRSASYSMYYIYDKFEWDHCAADGYDFQTLLDDMYELRRITPSSSTKQAKAINAEQQKIKAHKEMFVKRGAQMKAAQQRIDAKKTSSSSSSSSTAASTSPSVSKTTDEGAQKTSTKSGVDSTPAATPLDDETLPSTLNRHKANKDDTTTSKNPA